MKILLFGSGAREHALYEALKNSKLLGENDIYFAKTGAFAPFNVIEFCDYYELAKKARDIGINLLIVGPEAPLADGICDVFLKFKINVIGANSYWAQLESSKSFAKSFMKKFNIKTANYFLIEDISQIDGALLKFTNPPVIKADGLAQGKGVYLPKTFEEAKNVAKDFLGGKFGNSSKKIILEQRLFGRELSVFSLWDGKTLKSFSPACDFKKLLDDDKGENTGGMGSAYPCKLSDFELNEVNNYLKKLNDALSLSKADFCGVVYSGLMMCNEGLYVLEYNMRFGDPEIQSVLDNFCGDILDVFLKMVDGKLDEIDFKFKEEPSYCVVLASCGYPFSPQTGCEIFNLKAAKKYGVKVLLAGVKKLEDKYYTNGGRVLSLVKSGKNALLDIYKAAQEIKFDGKIYRKDIRLR